MLKTLRRVFAYAKPYIGYVVLTVIFAAAGTGLSLAVPVFIGEAVDCCTGRGEVDFEKLRKIVVLLAVIVVSSGLFQWLMSLCTNKLRTSSISWREFPSGTSTDTPRAS